MLLDNGRQHMEYATTFPGVLYAGIEVGDPHSLSPKKLVNGLGDLDLCLVNGRLRSKERLPLSSDKDLRGHADPFEWIYGGEGKLRMFVGSKLPPLGIV